MRTQIIMALVLLMVTVSGCDNGDSSSADDTANDGDTEVDGGNGDPDTDTGPAKRTGQFSCQYQNTFAGFDCKEYIGSNWDDRAVREADCGFGYVEEDAELIDEPCPKEAVIDGEPLLPLGGCRVNKGTEDEFIVYSFEGDAAMIASSCSTFQKGEWEEGPGFVQTPIDDEDCYDVEKNRQSMPEALDALDSTDEVTVSSQCKELDCLIEMIENNESFDFTPQGQEIKAGFIFYPGKVDQRAYSPSAVEMAKQGIFVSQVPMDCFLALNGLTRADDVRAANPQITKWFVGGHSLGGTAAVQYALTDSGKSIDGVIIWDSVTDGTADMSGRDIPVLSIYTTENATNTPEDVQEYAKYLPEDTLYIQIDGGDHAQFAYYYDDVNPATISREDQQNQVITATLDFINDNL